MTRRIVGLSGYARCGKDSIAAVLAERGWHQASFAAALKKALYILDPPVATLYGRRLRDVVDSEGWEFAKDAYPLVREMLQRMGTEVGRQMFGENVWVDAAFRALPADVPVVFADCRFPNEAQAITDAGGQVWRIIRPGFEPVNAHPSETALDGYAFDRVIVNDGSLGQLRAVVLDGELLRSP